MNDNVSTLEYKDLYYDVPNVDPNIKSKHARLIRSLSGKIESGRLTAVLGSSGCGKTHFLQMLVGEISIKSKTSGEILYNGKKREPEEWKNIMSYLKQDDVFYKDISVFEHMKFYSSLKFKDSSEKIINDKIDEILESCAIIHKKHTLMGALSGGERKRALIAIALVNDPKVLVLDEPTTGLDSNTALEIVFTLKKYAQEKNCMVITTIHQPGAGLFSYFDDLIILVKLGVFYIGPYDEVQDFLVNNGITMDNNLSLPEFLFVILSDHSLLPEAKKYRSNVDAIIERNRKQFKTEKTTHVCNNYKTITWSSSLSDMFIIIEMFMKVTNGIVYSWRYYWQFFVYIFPYLFYIFIIIIDWAIDSFNDVEIEGLDSCTCIELFDISCFVISELFVNSQIYFSILFMYTSVWNYKDPLFYEYLNGRYNIGTYFFAKFLFCFVRAFLYFFLCLCGIIICLDKLMLNPFILFFSLILCLIISIINACMLLYTEYNIRTFYFFFWLQPFTILVEVHHIDPFKNGIIIFLFYFLNPKFFFNLFLKLRWFDLISRLSDKIEICNKLEKMRYIRNPYLRDDLKELDKNEADLFNTISQGKALFFTFLSCLFFIYIVILLYKKNRVPNIRLKFTK